MYCVLEALNKKTESWECFGVSEANRYYALFSRIADVRNSEHEDTYIEPIDSPRGWPFNASNQAETWRSMHSFIHSDTWLNRTELISLAKWAREQLEIDLWKQLEFGHLSYLFDLERGECSVIFNLMLLEYYRTLAQGSLYPI